MFENAFQTELPGGERSLCSFSLAFAGHLAAVGAIAGASLLVVEKVSEKDLPLIFVRTAQPPLPVSRIDLTQTPDPSRGGGGNPEPARRGIPPPPHIPPRSPAPLALREPLPEIPEMNLTGGPGIESDVTGLPEGDPFGSLFGVRDGTGEGLPGVGPGLEPGPGPVAINPEIEPPVLLHKVQPDYPPAARAVRLPGRVILQAVIGIDGNVQDILVLSSSHAFFDSAAIDAVRQWTYRPALLHGAPISVYFTVTVSFVLH